MDSLIDLVRLVSTAYSLLIIARVLLSWVSPDPRNALVALIHRLTEPVMAPARRLVPSTGGIDFSPMLVLAGLWMVEHLLIRVLLAVG